MVLMLESIHLKAVSCSWLCWELWLLHSLGVSLWGFLTADPSNKPASIHKKNNYIEYITLKMHQNKVDLRTEITPVEMQMHSSLSVQVSFEVVLEFHSGLVDQHAAIFFA